MGRRRAKNYLQITQSAARGPLLQLTVYNPARTYVHTKNNFVSLGRDKNKKVSSEDLIFDGGHELLHLPDFTGCITYPSIISQAPL
jgi:hypothetical protein